MKWNEYTHTHIRTPTHLSSHKKQSNWEAYTNSKNVCYVCVLLRLINKQFSSSLYTLRRELRQPKSVCAFLMCVCAFANLPAVVVVAAFISGRWVQRGATFSDSGNVIYFCYSLFLKHTAKNKANNQKHTHIHNKHPNVECRFGYISILACFHLLSLLFDQSLTGDRSISAWSEHFPKFRSTSLIVSFFWEHSFKIIIKCLENWYHQNTIIVFAVHFPLWSHFLNSAVLSTL